MTASPETLRSSYPAVAESVPVARTAVAAVAAQAGASEECLGAVRLAVSEALTNVVVHAYDGEPGNIDVAVAIADEELWVLIADDGRGLRAGEAVSGLGVGMALMALTSESFTIAQRSSGGIEVRLGFSLAEAGRASRGYVRGSRLSATRPATSRFSTTV